MQIRGRLYFFHYVFSTLFIPLTKAQSNSQHAFTVLQNKTVLFAPPILKTCTVFSNDASEQWRKTAINLRVTEKIANPIYLGSGSPLPV